MTRPSISKRTRFEIFKRDGFACLYCGATPQTAPLVVDHVKPVADGGTSDPSNLVTACEPCNQGKGAVPLEQRRHATGIATEAQQEQAEQMRAYLAVQRDILDAKGELRQEVESYWLRYFDLHPNTSGVLVSAVAEFGLSATCEAIDLTARKPRGGDRDVQYFCGILRRWRYERSTSTPGHEKSYQQGVDDGNMQVINDWWNHRTRCNLTDDLVLHIRRGLSVGITYAQILEMMTHASPDHPTNGESYNAIIQRFVDALAAAGVDCEALDGDA